MGHEIIGHTVEELLGKELFTSVVKGYLDRCFEGEEIHYQSWFDFPETGKRFMDVYYYPFRETDHTISGAVVNSRDITRRKTLEDKLRESEVKYLDLYDNAPDMYASVDAEKGTINECNRTLADKLGYEKSELIGQPLYKIYHPCCMSNVKGAFQIFKTKGEVHNAELQLKRKDGGKIDVLLNATAVRNEQGDIVYSRSCLNDIADSKRMEKELQYANDELDRKIAERTDKLEETNKRLVYEIEERKQIEGKLKENRWLLQSIIDNTTAIIYVKDIEGKYLFINSRLEKLFHIRKSEIAGKSDYDFFPKELADHYRMNDLKVIETGKAIEIEEAARQDDGLHTYLSIKFPLYDREGNLYGTCGISTDITERKKIEESYARAQRIAKIGNWDWDIVNNTVYWSDEIFRIFGLKPQEFKATYEAFLSSVHPEDVESVKEAVNKALHKNEPYKMDHRIMLNGGVQRTVYEHGEVLFNEQGKAVRMIGTVQDVTKTRKIESALKESEVNFKALAENANDGIIVSYETGQHVYANKRACQLSGYDAAEIIRKKSGELIYIRSSSLSFKKPANLLIMANLASQFDAQLICKDEKQIDVEVTWSKTLWKGQNAIIIIIRDISARKKAAQALSDSEKRYKELYQQFSTLLNGISDALVLLNSDLKVVWANKRAVNSTGIEFTGNNGRYCYELWHRKESCSNCPAQRSFKTGKQDEGRHTDFMNRIWETRTFPLKNEKGEITGVIELAGDVTERIALESKAMQSKHLASLGELSAGVAHEINNPVTAMINYAQLIIDMSDRDSGFRQFAEEIINEGDRISNIVRSLLSFARESGVGKKPTNLSALFDDVLNIARTQLRHDGIRLTIDIPKDLPEITMDRQQIQQVFMNLISNARYSLNEKFRQRGENKVIEITVEYLRKAVPSAMRIKVSDRGTGIPGDIKDKILSPFFTTKPAGKGTGLGLSISHGIIQDHHGAIAIESVEGEYTTFIIYLPIGEDSVESKSINS